MQKPKITIMANLLEMSTQISLCAIKMGNKKNKDNKARRITPKILAWEILEKKIKRPQNP